MTGPVMIASAVGGTLFLLLLQLSPLIAFVVLIGSSLGWGIGKVTILSLPGFVDLTPLLPFEWLKEEEVEEDTPKAEEASSVGSLAPPWEGLQLPVVVDSALQEFIDLTLKTYVHEWYLSEISTDACFLVELRHQIRWVASSLLRRLQSSSLGRRGPADWLLSKGAPVAAAHADAFAKVRRHLDDRATTPAIREQRVLDFFRPSGNLHRALYSRDAELAYLRRLAEFLIRDLSDAQRLNGTDSSSGEWAANPAIFLRELVVFAFLLPVVDVLAEPDTLNLLLAVLFDPSPMLVYDDPPGPTVPVLAKLTQVSAHETPDSLVQVKLSEVMREPELLFAFMNYLKAHRGPLAQLQFLLSAEELQERLRHFLHAAEVDVATSEEEAAAHLHWEAWEIFRNYVHEGAPDRLPLPTELCLELQSVVEGPAEGAPSRLEAPLLGAYRLVYAWLQVDHVIPFCQSEAYMRRLIGERSEVPTPNQLTLPQAKDLVRAKGKSDGFTMAKFQKKLTGVFKASVEDGLDLLSQHFKSVDRSKYEWMVMRGREMVAERPVRIRMRPLNLPHLHEEADRLISSSESESLSASFSSPALLSPFDVLPTWTPTEPRRLSPLQWLKAAPLRLLRSARVRPVNTARRRAATLPYARLEISDSLRRSETLPGQRVAVNAGSEVVTEEMDFEASTHPSLVASEDVIDPSVIAAIQDDASRLNSAVSTSDVDSDLSAWRVRVPRVEPRRDPGSGKMSYVYILHVVPAPSPGSQARLLGDLADEAPVVSAGLHDEGQGFLIDRRYGEWYVLESKLIEFHGPNILSSSLPSKRTFVNKGRAFVESHRAAFEGFLQTLVSRNDLKNSELIRTFLTSRAELTPTSIQEILNPWRAMKKGAGKLSRERGQHLSSFISSFMAQAASDGQPAPGLTKARSQASTSPMEGRSEGSGISGLSFLSTALDPGLSPKAKLHGSIFGNNSGLLCEENVPRMRNGAEGGGNGGSPALTEGGVPASLYDIILFALARVLSLSDWVFTFLVSIRIFAKATLDRLVGAFLRHKLRAALHERKQAHLIHILRDVLFYEEKGERSDAQKRKRKEETFHAIISYLRSELGGSFVGKALGVGLNAEGSPGAIEQDIELIFDGLQHPRLNKHLSYQLLDIALADLWPQLAGSS